MKPSSILIGVSLVLAAIAGWILFPGGVAGSEGGLGGSSAETRDDGLPLRQTEGLALAPEAAKEKTQEPDSSAAGSRVALETPGSKAAASLTDLLPKGPFLRGIVTDSQGFPIPDATLKVTGEGPAATVLNFTGSPFVERTTSGANGEFQVTRRGLLGDEVTLFVRARGYLPLEEQREPDMASGDAYLGALQLERGVVLAGQVVDVLGNPVAEAELRRTTPDDEGGFNRSFMFGGGRGEIQTDAEGRFELPNEEPGAFVLLVEHEDYPRARLEGDAPYAGYEDNGLVVRFPAAATIQGRITGMPRGKTGIAVHAVPSESASESDSLGPMAVFMSMAGMEGGERAIPEDDGSFVLKGLDPDRGYELMATIEGGVFQQVRCSERVRAKGGDQAVELAWDSGASIAFQVVDAATDKPIKSSTVRYRWDDDSFGGFQIGSTKRDFLSSQVLLTELRPNPAPGNLSLLISSDGYLELKKEKIEITENAEVDLGTIRLTRAPMVRVHVVDAVTGEGLRRGRVSLSPDLEVENAREAIFGGLTPKATKGSTEKDGWCELAATASETATLTVRRSGYATYVREEVPMPTSGELELTVKLSGGGELEVTIVDTAGAPVGGAEMKYEGPDESRGSATASSKGRIKLKDLPAGEYKVRAERPTSSPWGRVGGQSDEVVWQTLNLAADSTQELVLRVPRETRIQGVVSANGAPIEGATVGFVSGPAEAGSNNNSRNRRSGRRGFSMGADETTDSRGAFELGDLAPGSHSLSVVVNAGAPPHLVPVELVEGDNRISVDLNVGKLTGKVVGPDGQPVPGALVRARAVAEPVAVEDEDMQMAMAFFGTASEGQETDANGRFELTGLQTDVAFSISASAPGFVDRSALGNAKAGDTGVVVELDKSASIRVKLIGDPTAFAVVRARQDSGSSRSEWVAGSEVVFRDVEPGKWTLSIRKQDGEQGPSAEVTVVAGQEAVVTLER